MRNLHRSLSILTPREKRSFFLHLGMNITISMVDLFSLALLVIVAGFYSEQSLPPWFASRLPSTMMRQDTILLALVVLSIFTFKNTIAYLALRSQFHYCYKVATRISETSLHDYLNNSYLDYVSRDSSVHVRRIGQIANEFAQHILAGFQQMIAQLFLVAVATIAIVYYQPELFLFLFVVLLPPVGIIAWIMKSKIKSSRSEIKINSERSTQYLQEALAGYIETNIYHKKDFFIQRYIKTKERLNRCLAQVQTIQSANGRMAEWFAVLGLVILISISMSGLAPAYNTITIGAFMAAAYKIIPGILKILAHSGQIRTYAFTIDELPTPKDHVDHKSSTLIESLAIENLSFSYGEKNIFNNLNCRLNKGDFAGITGNSGMGKTTLVNLILGLIEPDSGTIKINGMPANQSQRKSFWSRIAYARQQPFLLHHTIKTNISLSDNGVNHQRLRQAVKASGVNSISDGELDEMVKENGRNISGGQKQRIAIARVFYKEADLIILDEPFNELDDQSEYEMLAHCKQLASEGKIVLLITHNKNCLSFCNKMIDLNES